MTTIAFRSVANVLGSVLQWLAVPLLVPLALALWDGTATLPFLAALALTLGVGYALARFERDDVNEREAFLTVALAWLAVAAVGAVPFVLAGTGVFVDPVNAIFESMSGITTTGATVVRDFGAHSGALLMWRQLLQWLGGLGILLLATAVLSRLSVAGAQLMESETREHTMTKLTPKIGETAKIIVGLYIGLTAAATVVLLVLGLTGVAPAMTAYDALAHALTAIATAGFSPRPESIGAFAPVVHWVVVLFMVLGATNFALLYALVRGDYRRLLESEEFWVYLGLLGGGSLLMIVLLIADAGYDAGLLTTVRDSVFQITSIVTTTGYATADFDTWSAAAKHVLFVGMFVGGMAGSTTCSIKALRWLIVAKSFRRDLAVAAHVDLVKPVRLSGEVVEEETIRDVYAYTLIALVIFLLSTVVIVSNGARSDPPLTEFEALSAAASTFFNIGPAFGRAGPFGTYEGFARSSKLLMTVLMWIGRIEIIPVLVLLTPSFWRR